MFQINYKSIDDIPDRKLLTFHRKYWTFIADLGYKVPIINKNGQPLYPLSYCFLCEYAFVRKHSTCRACPAKIMRSATNISKPCLGGLYGMWLAAEGETRRQLGLEIANLELEEIDNVIKREDY